MSLWSEGVEKVACIDISDVQAALGGDGRPTRGAELKEVEVDAATER